MSSRTTPHLNRKRSCSWSLYRTWQRHEPPSHCPPFTLRCAWLSPLSCGEWVSDAQRRPRSSVSTAFSAAENFGHYRVRNALSSDMVALLLPRTKSGTRYGYPVSVIIHDRTLLRLLRRLWLVSFYPQRRGQRRLPLPWASRFDRRPRALADVKTCQIYVNGIWHSWRR